MSKRPRVGRLATTRRQASVTSISAQQAKTPLAQQKVRIIGGEWRGRQLPVLVSDSLRPTGDRIRETLFNWLQFEWPASHWLDLFAGTGALGFEALSRGASSVVMLEKMPAVVAQLKHNQQHLQAQGADIQQADSFLWLSRAAQQQLQARFDGIFCDPPFADERIEQLLELILSARLLKPGGWLYLEQPAQRSVALPDSFTCYRQQTAGQVTFALWRYQDE